MNTRSQGEAAVYQRPTTRSAKCRQRGSSLVEQALVLTFLLAVMFGIIDFGRALYTYHFVSEAAREATRWASVRGSTTTLPGGQATNGPGGNVQAFVANVSGMGLDSTKITATTNWPIRAYSNPSCVGAGNNKKNPGCIVQVQVDYAFQFTMPFLPPSTTTFNMSSTSEMVITQ
jgi:Flp pilus assembly protein TadG